VLALAFRLEVQQAVRGFIVGFNLVGAKVENEII